MAALCYESCALGNICPNSFGVPSREIENLGSLDGTVVFRYHHRAMTLPTPRASKYVCGAKNE